MEDPHNDGLCAGCGRNELREHSADAVEAHSAAFVVSIFKARGRLHSSTRAVQPAKHWGMNESTQLFLQKTWTFSHWPQLLRCCTHYFMDVITQETEKS